jgi:hypothetical protein
MAYSAAIKTLEQGGLLWFTTRESEAVLEYHSHLLKRIKEIPPEEITLYAAALVINTREAKKALEKAQKAEEAFEWWCARVAAPEPFPGQSQHPVGSGRAGSSVGVPQDDTAGS